MAGMIREPEWKIPFIKSFCTAEPPPTARGGRRRLPPSRGGRAKQTGCQLPLSKKVTLASRRQASLLSRACTSRELLSRAARTRRGADAIFSREARENLGVSRVCRERSFEIALAGYHPVLFISSVESRSPFAESSE